MDIFVQTQANDYSNHGWFIYDLHAELIKCATLQYPQLLALLCLTISSVRAIHRILIELCLHAMFTLATLAIPEGCPKALMQYNLWRLIRSIEGEIIIPQEKQSSRRLVHWEGIQSCLDKGNIASRKKERKKGIFKAVLFGSIKVEQEAMWVCNKKENLIPQKKASLANRRRTMIVRFQNKTNKRTSIGLGYRPILRLVFAISIWSGICQRKLSIEKRTNHVNLSIDES